MLQTVLIVVAVALGQAAPDPAALVRRLGSSDVAEQKAAAAALLESGRAAMPALMAAREADDAGLRSRVLELCTRIEGVSVGGATRVRLELRDVPIDRAIAALGEATGRKLELRRPEPGDEDDGAIRRRRVTLVTPGEVPFWEAFEAIRRAAGLEIVFLGSPLQLGFEKPGTESGPVSISGAFRGQLLGVRRDRRLELGKATRGIERSSRAVPTRGGDVGPAVGPARETFVARLWVHPEPGARIIPVPLELDPRLPPGPGLKYRPGPPPFAGRAEDEQGRSLRPAGPSPVGTLVASNGYTEYVVEAPLSMPDPPGHRLARLEISVPFTLVGERQDPIDVRLAGARGRSVRGSGATLTIAAARRAEPSTREVTVTPDPPLGSGPETIRSRPGQLQFFDEQGNLLRPTVTETNAYFGGRRLTCRFRGRRIPGDPPLRGARPGRHGRRLPLRRDPSPVTEGLPRSYRMKLDGPEESGRFEARRTLAAGNHEYKYVLDGTRWRHDPGNRRWWSRLSGRMAQRGRCPAPQSTSGQSFQQRPGVHEVRRREPFRVRAVDGRQRGAGLVAAALPLPEPGEAHRGPQLPRLALLAPGRLDGLAEAVFGGGGLVGRLGQQQLALEAVQLGLVAAVVVLLGDRQPFVQRLVRVLEARRTACRHRPACRGKTERALPPRWPGRHRSP